MALVPDPVVERFARDLDALIAPDARVGIAVSGGPDSLALLLLAAAARPGRSKRRLSIMSFAPKAARKPKRSRPCASGSAFRTPS